MRTYRLVNRKPVPCDDYFPRMTDAERRVGDTKIGEARVSTVFLSLDHNFDLNGPPILFETMVFGGPNDQDLRRYSTWEEAEAGHAEWVERERSNFAASFGDVEAR